MARAAEADQADVLRRIKSSPGAASLSTMLAETEKLTALASFHLPSGLSAGVAPPALKDWRDR